MANPLAVFSGGHSRVLRWTVGATLLLALLFLLVVAALHLPFARTAIRGWAENRLRNAGLDVAFGELDYNLLTLSFTVGPVRLAPTDLPNRPFFTAPRVVADLAWMDLAGPLRIASLVVTEPALTLERDASDRLNLPLGSGSDGGGIDAIVIDRLVVEGLAATYNDVPAEIALAGRDVTVQLNPPASDDIRGTLEAAGGVDITLGERRLRLDAVDARLGFDGRDVSFDPLVATTGGGELRIAGRLVDVLDDMALDLAVEGSLPIEGLRAAAPEVVELTGPVMLSGRVGGSASDPTVDVRLSTAGLGWRSYTDVGLDSTLHVTSAGLVIENLEATSARGSVKAAGAISWSGETSWIEASWEGVEVGSLLGAVLGADAPPLSAAASGTASAMWTGLSFEIDALDLDARFSRSSVRRGLPVTGTMTAAIAGGRWSLRQDLQAGSTSLASRLGGAWSGTDALASTLDGPVQVQVSRIGDLLADLERAGLARADALEGLDLQGTATLDARLAGRLNAPDLAGSLQLDGRYRPAAAGAAAETDAWPPIDLDLGARLTIVDGDRLTLEAIDGQAGSASVSGSVGWAIESGSLDGSLDARFPSLETLPLPAALRGAIQGSASGRVVLSGTSASPVAAATLAGSAIELAGQRFSALDTAVRFDAGTLHVDSLRLTQPGGSLTASGSYVLSTGQITLDASATTIEIRPWSQPGRLDSAGPSPGPASPSPTVPVSGTLSFDVEGSGTLEAPTAVIRATLADGRWQDVELGAVSMTADIVDGLAQVTADAPELGFDADGQVAVSAPQSFTVRANLRHDDVQQLVGRWTERAVADRVRGRVAATIDATGQLGDLEAAVAEINIGTLDLTVNELPVTMAPASVRYADGRVTARNAAITAGGSIIRVDGELAAGASSRLAVTLQGQLADFSRLAAVSPATAALEATGPLNATLDVEGSLREPVVSGRVDFGGANLRWGDAPAIEVLDAVLALDANAIDLDLASVRWLGATLEARASVPASLSTAWVFGAPAPAADEVATLSARFDAVVPTLVAAFAPELAEDLDGAFAGTVNLQTATPDLEDLDGEIILDTARLQLARVPFDQLSTTHLVVDEGVVRVQDWTWGGAGNEVSLGGQLLLTGERTIEVSVLGALDLRVLSVLQDGLSVAGAALLDVSLDGPVASPGLTGYIDLQSVSMRLADPRLIVADVDGFIDFTGDRIELDSLTGEANGGPIRITGGIDIADVSQPSVGIQLVGQGLAFEYPGGLRTEIDVDLSLVDTEGRHELAGLIEIQQGTYQEALNLTTQALARLGATPAGAAAGAPGWMDRLQLNVQIVTAQDVYVDNNYGRLELGLDVRLVGTLGRPGLLGRASLREGGIIFLGGNTYQLAGGTIDFTDPTRIRPQLDITAETRVSSYAITLNLSGTPEAFRTDLSSDPPLGQGDLVSLLMTGRTLEDSGGIPTGGAGAQALRYLSGDILGFLGETVGFTNVRLERGVSDDLLDLTSADEDAATRLTIAQRLSEVVEVVFSQNLRESGALTWLVIYRPWRSFDLTYISRDDNSDSFGFRHQLLFGGRPRARAAREVVERPRIERIEITGAGALTESLRDRLDLEEGDAFDFYAWQDDRDRLERDLQSRGYLEAAVTADRQESADTVRIEYAVQPGPRTTLEVTGVPSADALVSELEQIWRDAVLDEFMIEDMRRAVAATLLREGYLRPEIVVDIDRPAEDEKITRVSATPGEPTERREIVFEGNTAFTREELLAQIAISGLSEEAWVAPDALRDRLEASYQVNGYLEAQVTVAPAEFDGAVARLPVRIDEGPQYRVASIDLEGIGQRDAGMVRTELGVAPGDVYRPELLETGRAQVDAAYRAAGFNEVRTGIDVALDPEEATVAAVLRVDEGPRQVLREVIVEGDVATRRSTIDEALQLEPGTPVNAQALYEASRRLYETGVFRSVDIDPRPVDEGGAEPGAETEPVRAVVTLEEWEPYRVRYGLQVNSDPTDTPAGEIRETSLGLVADIQRRNLFGRAISTGAAIRYRPDRRAVRVFASTLRTLGLPLTSSVFFTDSRETFNTEGLAPFTTDERSVTFEQRVGQLAATQVAYGYRFGRNHTFIPDDTSGIPFDIVVDIARLNGTALHDSRDNPLNPGSGWFHSSSFEYSQGWLGSDVRFVKYLAQHFQYPRIGPVVLASAIRLGVGWPLGIDEELIPSERFFAGGGTTVRGYEQDSLGPEDFFGDPAGGEALLVLNEEVRFPIYRWLGGVGFIDAGTVFPTPADITPGGLKVGVGLGARVDTPFGLFRVDFGVPLDRDDGDPQGRWYFSIGQMF